MFFMNDKIAVLIPCYNEEKTIKKVVLDFMKELPDAVLYVYDNNSTDNTYEIAKTFGDRVIVRKEYRQGKGNVVRSMFRQINADCYIIVDGDDTYPAEHAKEMSGLILNEGFDMVIGDRLSSTYFDENKRLLHNFGNKLVRFLINKLFRSNIKDIMTGYRAFSYEFVKMTAITSEGFEIETEMTINALDKKFLLKEIDVQYRDRPEGSTSKLNTFRDGFKVLRTIFIMCKDYKPFTFFCVLSIILILISLSAFIPVLLEFFNTGIVPKIPTLIVCTCIFITAIVLFAIGIILDVIVKKNKQDYIMKLNILSSNRREI